VLTTAAHELIERQYLKALSAAGLKDGDEIVVLLRQPRAELQIGGKHAKLAKVIGELHSRTYPPAEKQFYWDHLVLGGPEDSTHGLQGLLVNLMGKVPSPKAAFDREDLRALVKLARRAEGDCETLAGSTRSSRSWRRRPWRSVSC